MVYNTGTGITDHIAMLDKLIEVVTSRNMTTVSVIGGSGGTGYIVGEILNIDATGATSTDVAQIEVTSISGGVIDGVRVYRGGAYTIDPTNKTPNTTTSTGFKFDGTVIVTPGINATITITFSASTWSLNRRTKQTVIALPTITVVGSGYAINDVLTVSGGVIGDGGSSPTYTVATIGGGGSVATITRTTGGNLEEAPANPAATTVVPSGGIGCTLTITYENPPQSAADGQVAMLQGVGLGGTDAIHVIIKTFAAVNGFDTAYNWSVMGSTGYNATLPIQNQTGINPVQIVVASGALPLNGRSIACVVLKNVDGETAISWTINHNGRRIIMVCAVHGSTTVLQSSMYAGFLNQLATDTEYPYPLWICGGTSVQNRLWTDFSNLTGGIVEVISSETASADPVGPGFLKLPGTEGWISHASELSNSPSLRNVENEFGIYPFISTATLLNEDQTVALTADVDWSSGLHSIIPPSGVPGTPGIQLKPTTGAGAVRYWLVAPIVMRTETNLFPSKFNMWGEIDGVFWFSTGNNVVVSGDRFILTTKRYTIFGNGNRTQVWSYFALDED